MYLCDTWMPFESSYIDKGLYCQSHGFSSSHVWLWDLDHKEGWVPMNWCFWTVVLEKTLESPLDSKEIKPVHPKGNQPWIFTGRTDAEAETPILWPPVMKNQLTGKDPDAGKEGRTRRGWQRIRWVDGIIDSMNMSLSRFRDIVKDSLACCSSGGHKELDMSEQLNNNNNLYGTPIHVHFFPSC